jgi:hypothetical protein
LVFVCDHAREVIPKRRSIKQQLAVFGWTIWLARSFSLSGMRRPVSVTY